MDKGYFISAVDSSKSKQRLKAAVTLGNSLRKFDPDHDVCLMVTDMSSVDDFEISDGILVVETPFGRSVENDDGEFWQIYFATPFSETIVIDPYSIALSDDISSLWTIGSVGDLVFGKPKDFRNRFRLNRKKSKIQRKNGITYFDTDLVFFRKSEEACEFFKMADPIVKNWKKVYDISLFKYKDSDFDLTLILNLTMKWLNNVLVTNDNYFYTKLDLNFMYDEENEIDDIDWIRSLGLWVFEDMRMKVNNHRQYGLVNYGPYEFITENLTQVMNGN